MSSLLPASFSSSLWYSESAQGKPQGPRCQCLRGHWKGDSWAAALSQDAASHHNVTIFNILRHTTSAGLAGSTAQALCLWTAPWTMFSKLSQGMIKVGEKQLYGLSSTLERCRWRLGLGVGSTHSSFLDDFKTTLISTYSTNTYVGLIRGRERNKHSTNMNPSNSHRNPLKSWGKRTMSSSPARLWLKTKQT